MDLARFEQVDLLPEAQAYRDVLDAHTEADAWDVGAAVMTLFVEGTAAERAALEGRAGPPPPLEDHPLVRHYGLPVERLLLTKAHRAVEGDHRRAAWRVVLDFVPVPRRPAVIRSLEDALAAWLTYRDAVAKVCGVERASRAR
jgi:pyrroloquinoline-quinone synthase